MKKFSVKDYILYSSPCFGCGKPRFLKISQHNSESIFATGLDLDKEKCVLTTKLKITYRDELIFDINYLNNKFDHTNAELVKYLKDNSFYLRSECFNCNSFNDTTFLELNYEKGLIKPFNIEFEKTKIIDKEKEYLLYSNFSQKKSYLFIHRNDGQVEAQLEYPLLPLYAMRNKEHLLKKIKMYLIFS